jgi:hypothetical protein
MTVISMLISTQYNHHSIPYMISVDMILASRLNALVLKSIDLEVLDIVSDLRYVLVSSRMSPLLCLSDPFLDRIKLHAVIVL